MEAISQSPRSGNDEALVLKVDGVINVDKNQEAVTKKKKKGKIIQRNYVLNDAEALKKKVRQENKMKQEIAIGKEGKDGSNITVPMKASFFEFVKANFIQDLEDNDDILKIENAEGVKATTENSGDAYVEYSMEISFLVGQSTHTVKLIAYTTTSQLMIQPIGEKSGLKEHLGQRGTPRFFVEEFLLPWSEKSINEKRFNEAAQKMYMSALREEIRKLDMLKLDQRRTSKNPMDPALEITDVNAKCVAKSCSFQGLNPQNKSAVGLCAKCGNFEHFACVKIKAEHKEDIMKGIMKYYCSVCFSKNPSLITFESQEAGGKALAPKHRPRIGSIPLMGQGYLFKVTHSTTATPIGVENETPGKMTDNVKGLPATTTVKKCENCPYEANSAKDLGAHIESNHKPTCTKCDKAFCTTQELQTHIENEHNNPCRFCDKNFPEKTSLDDHLKANHSFTCNSCTLVASTLEELNSHVETDHNFQCLSCTETFKTKADIEEHTTKSHSHACSFCTRIAKTLECLNKHNELEHNFSCKSCQSKFPDKDSLDEHTNGCSKNPCTECSEVFQTIGELDTHSRTNHSTKCTKCPETFIEKTALENHFQSQHSHPCTHCEAALPTTESLNEHCKETHAFLCMKCNISFSSMEDCNVHTNSVHMDAMSSNQNKERIIECASCEINFDNTEKLKEHMEKEHSHECTTCNQNFKTKSILKSHMEREHVIQCNLCDEKMKTFDDMNMHVASTHTFVCSTCNHKSSQNDLLEQHILLEHPLMCIFCGIQSENTTELNSHIQTTHTYDCEVCDFVGEGEEVMEDHILDLHAQPDSDQVYKCDDCSFQSANKTSFGKHYKSYHGSKSKQKNPSSPANNNDDDKQKLEAELRQLRNNFERLEGMYHESLEEVNQVKSEYEAKLIRANDNHARMMSENEVLKEKVDVLFKLGRSYLNRENKNMEKETETEVNAEAEDDVQVVEEEREENVENLQTWTKNKLRGFKRTNPATNAAPKATKAAPKSATSDPSAKEAKAPPRPPPSATTTSGQATTSSPPARESENVYRARYCHYFVNTGKCNYEERTGLKCRFEHRTAPMCNFGMSCSRAKCMYSHPKLTGANNSFLGNSRGLAPMMNPWQQGQMMNPWMTTPASQFMPSPWNVQANPNQRQNQQ